MIPALIVSGIPNLILFVVGLVLVVVIAQAIIVNLPGAPSWAGRVVYILALVLLLLIVIDFFFGTTVVR